MQWNYKGHVAFRLGEYEEALEAYTQSLLLDPKSHVIFTKRSETYRRFGDTAKALDDANKALKLKPTYT